MHVFINVLQHYSGVTVINPEFIGYLRLTVSPETVDVYSNAYNVLTQTGSTQHEFAINQYLGMADQDDTATTLASIEECLSQSLADRLGDHGIYLAERNLELMSYMLEACSMIDNYGDPELIYNIANSDETAELKFCEIMELFSPYKWSDFVTIIEHVSVDLMKGICELLKERAETSMEISDRYENEPLVISKDEIRKRLLKYIEGKPNLLILRLIQEGMPLGLDIELYVQSCKDTLAALPVPAFVSEITAMALAANLLNEDLTDAIKEQIDSFHADINSLTQASVALSRESYHE